MAQKKIVVCDVCGKDITTEPHIEVKVLVGHRNAGAEPPNANYAAPFKKHLCRPDMEAHILEVIAKPKEAANVRS